MLLHALLRQFDPAIDLAAVLDLPITGIEEDSRAVRPGALFVARPGTQSDGRSFIADAAARGAVAVVAEKADTSLLAEMSLPLIQVADPAAAASRLAHLFFGRPSEEVQVLGITGTNGKTTCAYLVRHLLEKVSRRCGLIGTVEIDDGAKRSSATMTTPGAVEVAGLLARMRDAGCRSCAMEVSSHALDQRRADGVSFAGAAFTNLTGDHLDYHRTMDQYAAAKAKLFEQLGPQAVAVVNAEDTHTARMIQRTAARIVRFGFTRRCDYAARDVSITAAGTSFTLITPDGQAPVSMSLIGRYNIANALCAAGLVGEVFGLSVHQIVAGLADAAGAPGRLQAVRAGQPFTVLVDYAHSDDALDNVLKTLRPLARGRLRVLFGCGGERDRGKRPRMAAVACRWADQVWITDDNPRRDDPAVIRQEIFAGVPSNRRDSVVVQPDRREAIERILTEAQENDVIVLAGKGHETYQQIGTIKHPFDDVEVASRVLTGTQTARRAAG